MIEIVNNKRVTIEKVTEKNYQEALDIEGSIKEFGGKEAIVTPKTTLYHRLSR